MCSGALGCVVAWVGCFVFEQWRKDIYKNINGKFDKGDSFGRVLGTQTFVR